VLEESMRPMADSKPARSPDPRPARTRRALLDAGHRLITEKGVAALRIQEITERADVALGSFYNHFKTKDDLVEAVVFETLSALASEIIENSASDDDPAVAAITALRRFVRLAYEDVDFARLLVNLGRGDELFLDAITPFATTALERTVAAGAFEIEDVEVAVAAIVGGGLSMIRRILDGSLGPGADAVYARMALRSFGVETRQATRIIARTNM
jgi:AcrR family transcriptional regulator